MPPLQKKNKGKIKKPFSNFAKSHFICLILTLFLGGGAFCHEDKFAFFKSA
jgi:hypothetical protein